MALSIIFLFVVGVLFSLCIVLLVFYLQAFARLKDKEKKDSLHELFLNAILKDTVDSIYLKDTQSRILLTNDIFHKHVHRTPEEIYGYDDKELYGEEFGAHTIAEEAQIMETGTPMVSVIEERYTADGNNYRVLTTKVPVHQDGKVVGILGITRAFEDFAQQQEKLTHIAAHDDLTGLCNRAEIRKLLKDTFLQREPIALLFIDVDNFKEINDRYGHDVGDQVLQLISQRMKTVFRKNDEVGRYGGDEFVVILRRITAQEEAEVAAKNLLRELQQPMEIAGLSIQCRISIGIACTRACATEIKSTEQLIQSADQAMYEVKKRGKGGYAFFSGTEPET